LNLEILLGLSAAYFSHTDVLALVLGVGLLHIGTRILLCGSHLGCGRRLCPQKEEASRRHSSEQNEYRQSIQHD
jgi:hypothetical protein